ncbi:hypothetical protein BH23ACT2_BH23ACT2_03110 [soil metagenome]
MVSAMGTDEPPDDDEVFSVYLRAKAAADEAVRSSGLVYTIVRPGRLTDEPATGQIALARHVKRGEVPREDVAATLAAGAGRPGHRIAHRRAGSGHHPAGRRRRRRGSNRRARRTRHRLTTVSTSDLSDRWPAADEALLHQKYEHRRLTASHGRPVSGGHAPTATVGLGVELEPR